MKYLIYIYICWGGCPDVFVFKNISISSLLIVYGNLLSDPENIIVSNNFGQSINTVVKYDDPLLEKLELSSEVNDVEDRLVKRYADQQRRALMMNPKFGTPIGQAAELGKQYTPGRPGEGINYHDYKQRYKVGFFRPEAVAITTFVDWVFTS